MIESGSRDHLLYLADEYRLATGLSLGALSRSSYGMSSFLENYRVGNRTITTRKYDEMLDWFWDNWPKGHKRPRFPTIVWNPPSGVKLASRRSG